jgi:hypothetical protein
MLDQASEASQCAWKLDQASASVCLDVRPGEHTNSDVVTSVPGLPGAGGVQSSKPDASQESL